MRENLVRGAGEGIRTPDPLITNQMLYQLSYAGLLRVLKQLHHSAQPLSSLTVKRLCPAAPRQHQPANSIIEGPAQVEKNADLFADSGNRER